MRNETRKITRDWVRAMHERARKIAKRVAQRNKIRFPRTKASADPITIPGTKEYQAQFERLYRGEVTYKDFIAQIGSSKKRMRS